MSAYTTTSGDAYRDPRTHESYATQRPNQDAREPNQVARERRRTRQDDVSPKDQSGSQHAASSALGKVHSGRSSGTSTGSETKAKVNYRRDQLTPYDRAGDLKAHQRQDHRESQQEDGKSEDILELGDQIRASIYGHCIGDAIGLLTEFMSKEEAQKHYGKYRDKLELEHKIEDRHRRRWDKGDWTDDSDQMILIMQSLTDNKGKVSGKDFASRLLHWSKNGFEELNDTGGLGIGRTTYITIKRRNFKSEPQKAAKETWKESGEKAAPNGGVMRTSILGIHEFWDLEKVQSNAKEICKTTHFDPRCQASVIAVCVAIALMLQRKPPYFDRTTKQYDVALIINKCYECASSVLVDSYQKSELDRCLRYTDIETLRLDEENSIGYTFKCLGAGFWALKQNDFRKTLTQIVMSGGDADTNGAVAGALLGCKLRRTSSLPESWYNNLKYRHWLNEQISRYLEVCRPVYKEK